MSHLIVEILYIIDENDVCSVGVQIQLLSLGRVESLLTVRWTSNGLDESDLRAKSRKIKSRYTSLNASVPSNYHQIDKHNVSLRKGVSSSANRLMNVRSYIVHYWLLLFFFLRLTRDINFIRHSVNSNSLTGTDIRKLNITFVFRSTLFARLWFLLISVGIFYQFILLLIISAKKKKKQRGLFSVSCTLFSHVPFLFNVFSFPNKYWQLKQRFITIKSTKRWKLNHQR